MARPTLNVCRFAHADTTVRIGVVADGLHVIDLTPFGITEVAALLNRAKVESALRRVLPQLPQYPLGDITLLAPIDRQEVWAAGVTYRRSKTARMQESDFSATAYDRVYEAKRPEIFFKAVAEKVVATGDRVGIRRDARWNVPEPELALVLNVRGVIVGYTIGNDMSSRDIEGENLLYLPQAKIYQRSCALGPWITLGVSEQEARRWRIRIAIRRARTVAFAGETAVAEIKRSFRSLARYLFRSQRFPYGAVLLTGTGVVPPPSFTLRRDDDIEIEISGIGRLRNRVTIV